MNNNIHIRISASNSDTFNSSLKNDVLLYSDLSNNILIGQKNTSNLISIQNDKIQIPTLSVNNVVSDIVPSVANKNLGSSTSTWNTVYTSNVTASGTGSFGGVILGSSGANISGTSALATLTASNITSTGTGSFGGVILGSSGANISGTSELAILTASNITGGVVNGTTANFGTAAQFKILSTGATSSASSTVAGNITLSGGGDILSTTNSSTIGSGKYQFAEIFASSVRTSNVYVNGTLVIDSSKNGSFVSITSSGSILGSSGANISGTSALATLTASNATFGSINSTGSLLGGAGANISGTSALATLTASNITSTGTVTSAGVTSSGIVLGGAGANISGTSALATLTASNITSTGTGSFGGVLLGSSGANISGTSALATLTASNATFGSINSTGSLLGGAGANISGASALANLTASNITSTGNVTGATATFGALTLTGIITSAGVTSSGTLTSYAGTNISGASTFETLTASNITSVGTVTSTGVTSSGIVLGGAGANISGTSALGSLTASNATITGNTTITGNLVLGTNSFLNNNARFMASILPVAAGTGTYDIGAPTALWKDMYLASNLYVNGTKIIDTNKNIFSTGGSFSNISTSNLNMNGYITFANGTVLNSNWSSVLYNTLTPCFAKNSTNTYIDVNGDTRATMYNNYVSTTLHIVNNNNLYSCGRNSEGQLGRNNQTIQYTPSAITLTGDLAGKSIKLINSSQMSSLALDNNGWLYSWGSNIGNGTTDSTLSPLRVDNIGTSVLNNKNIVSIGVFDGGNKAKFVIDSDGNLYSWGTNSYGNLGLNSSTSSYVWPQLVNGTGSIGINTDIVSVAGGYTHTYALDASGQVHACGRNSSGQIGNNTTNNVLTGFINISTISTSSLYGKTIKAICAISEGGCALDSDGNVHAWGINTNGFCGDGTYTSPVLLPKQISTGSLVGKKVVAIATGYVHTLALDSTGKIHAWGENGSGRLGDNSTANRNTPWNIINGSITASTVIVEIYSCADNSYARDTNGFIHAWGSGTYGQLGQGNTSSSLIPVIINSSYFVNSTFNNLTSFGAVNSIGSLLGGAGANISGTSALATLTASNVTSSGIVNSTGLILGGAGANISGTSALATLTASNVTSTGTVTAAGVIMTGASEILPATTINNNIGSAKLQFAEIFSSNVRTSNVYCVGSAQFGGEITTNGITNTGKISSTTTISTSTQVQALRVLAGTTPSYLAPAFSFLGEVGTGIYRPDSGQIAFVCDGPKDTGNMIVTMSNGNLANNIITANCDIIPKTTLQNNIGSATFQFANVYSSSVTSSGTVTAAGVTLTGTNNILPQTTLQNTIGSATLQFAEIFSSNVRTSNVFSNKSVTIGNGGMNFPNRATIPGVYITSPNTQNSVIVGDTWGKVGFVMGIDQIDSKFKIETGNTLGGTGLFTNPTIILSSTETVFNSSLSVGASTSAAAEFNIDASGNITKCGTIGCGAITSTGTVTATSIVGTGTISGLIIAGGTTSGYLLPAAAGTSLGSTTSYWGTVFSSNVKTKGSILPMTTLTDNIGSAELQMSDVYSANVRTSNVYVNGTLVIDASRNITVGGNILPSGTTATSDLGSSTNKFGNIWGTTVKVATISPPGDLMGDIGAVSLRFNQIHSAYFYSTNSIYMNNTMLVDSSKNITAGTIMASGNSAIAQQGAYIQWSRSGSSILPATNPGATFLVNQKGALGGGFSFGEATTANVYTENMVLDSTGNLTVNGSVTAAGLTTSGTTDLTVGGQIYTGTDSASTPGYSWTGDTNMGIFRKAADTIGFATSGAEKVAIGSSGVSVTGAITSTGSMTAAGITLTGATNLLPTTTKNNDIGSSALQFNNVYTSNVNISNVYANGTQILDSINGQNLQNITSISYGNTPSSGYFLWRASGVSITNGGIYYGQKYQARQGWDQKTPAYSFQEDTGSGMYLGGVINTLSFACGYNGLEGSNVVTLSNGNLGNHLMTANCDIVPSSCNIFNLGSSTKCWNIVYTKNGVTTSSDESLKDSVPLTYGLSDLMNVSTIKYKWKTQADLPDDNPEKNYEYFGLCANELNGLFPELVYNEQTPFQVNYSEMIPVLVNAIKELNSKVDTLTQTISNITGGSNV